MLLFHHLSLTHPTKSRAELAPIFIRCQLNDGQVFFFSPFRSLPT
jgi:hypothetical protein